MTFAQPGWLWLGLLGVVVVLLHIRRRKVVEVSSIELWRHLVTTNKPHRAFRPPRLSIPLLLQLLAVALLTLALAKPQLEQAGVEVKHRIYILDASGSMNAVDGDTTRFEKAVTHLTQTLTRLEPDSNKMISLMTVGSDINIIAARLNDSKEVMQALETLHSSDSEVLTSDWEEVAGRIQSLIGEESFSVTVLTDGAAAENARASFAAQLSNAQLEVLSFGDGAANAALSEVRATLLEEGTNHWELEGKVQVFADEPQPLILKVLFTSEGTEGSLPWTEQELTAENGTANFKIDLELPAAGLLEVRLPGDALAYDNQTFIELKAVPRAARVLQIGPDNPPLQRALEAVGGLELFRADAVPPDSKNYDLVIVDRVSVTKHPGTNTLWLGGATPDGMVTTLLSNTTPTSWQSEHSLAVSVDWSTVELNAAFEVSRLEGSEVLLESSGKPLIQARTTGAGREVIVAFDLLNSSWTNELGFPVFISNIVRWVAPWYAQQQGQHCRVGSVCALEPHSLYQGLSLVPVSSSGEALTLPSPFVRPSPERPETAYAPFADLFYPQQAGLYRLEPGGELLMVDAPSTLEGDVRAEASSSVATSRQQGWPFFRWLLLLFLLVLLVEACIAGRGMDRFLQAKSLRRTNPLAIRHRLVLALRLGTAVLALLAVLGVSLFQAYREKRLVLVVDSADLYGPDAANRIQEAEAKLAQLGGAWRKEVVVLGQQGQVLTGEETLQAPGANLASTLDLSAGLLGTDGPGRIVVVASGTETQDDLARVLPELAARGTPVDVLPLGGVPSGEVLVESLSLPPRLYQGDSFVLQGTIYSDRSLPTTLRVWRDGELHTEQAIDLTTGSNRIDTELSEEEAGRYLYEYEVVVRDSFAENNRNGVIAEVLPKAKVALVSPQETWGTVLADALSLQGISAQVLTPLEVPFTLKNLLLYDTVILANVPAIDLHSTQQELLETWVRDYGGGLLILGGENTFGPGGYYQTALERVSPLSSRVPQEAPKVAMIFVLDRSGSMQQQVGEQNRLEIAKQATIAATKLLHPESMMGIEVFDTEATTLMPLQQVNLGIVQEALAPLQPGGGTAIYWALVSAYEQMRNISATTRHIVVMTDGLSQPADFDSLMDKIIRDEITVSTVAIGQGIDTTLLQRIARRGGGAFHATSDFKALPSILSQEALMLSSKPLEEQAFTPLWQNREAVFLEGMPESMPTLYGYIQTTAKPEATLHLSGPDDAPILASWRYGLGRVVAFTSQGAGRWSREWLRHPSYPLLWSQIVRWALPPVAKPGLHLVLEPSGDEVKINVRAVNEEGNLAEHLHLTASHKNSGLETDATKTLELIEVTPGLYQGTFTLDSPGRYQVEVSEDTTTFENVSGEMYQGYLARYSFASEGAERLKGLAAITGGRVLFGDEPLSVGSVPLRWRSLPAWPVLSLLALALLMLELTLRYASGVFALRRATAKARASFNM